MAKTPSEKLKLTHVIGYGCGDCGGVVTLYMVTGFLARFLQVNMQVNAGVLAAYPLQIGKREDCAEQNETVM